MAGISSKAVGSLINRKGYNGNELQNKEFSEGSGLELYDFNARTYDQQIGRFIQIDPESEEADQESWSPYHFTFDNPINHSDPDGTHPIIPILQRAYTIIRFLREVPWSRNAGRELPIATRDNVTTIIRIVTPILKDALTPTVVKTEEQQEPTKQRSASDQKLIDEAKELKAKENKSKERTQQRQQQTKEGKEKEGESNQETRGNHDSGSKSKADKQRHDAANARRAKEQAAADKKKAEAKKN